MESRNSLALSIRLQCRPSSQLLARAAQVAEHNPLVLAPTLAAYRQRHGVDERMLAAHLGCPLPAVHGLALCAQPSPDTSTFTTDVQRLAAYVGCDAERLLTLLRERVGRS